jgi:hypothetical protein
MTIAAGAAIFFDLGFIGPLLEPFGQQRRGAIHWRDWFFWRRDSRASLEGTEGIFLPVPIPPLEFIDRGDVIRSEKWSKS